MRRHKALARRTAPYPIPPPRAGRRQPHSHRHDRSEGARHAGRHLSSPPSALAKPAGCRPAQHTSQRRSATPFRPQRRECPLAREEPNENGREGAKSRENSSENAEKITANAGLSPDCVAYIVHTSRPCATIAQARKNGPLSSSEGKERTGLYRDAAHDGGGFPWLIRWLHPHIEGARLIRHAPLEQARGRWKATRQCRPHTAGRRKFVSLSAPPSPRLAPAARDRCLAPPPCP